MTTSLPKPPQGEPCNGCGGCCATARCALGAKVFGPGPRCPALEPQLPRWVCGLVVNPFKYVPLLAAMHGSKVVGEAASYIIGVNVGCDALVEGETPAPGFVESFPQRINVKKAKAAIKLWGLIE